uniref:GTPase n=1 Tax=Streptococcus ferus TaxID=1345 RepID=UPI0035A117EB
MGLVSFKDKDGNFGSAADVWNPERLEQLFNELNPNRKLRLEREKLAKEEVQEETQN